RGAVALRSGAEQHLRPRPREARAAGGGARRAVDGGGPRRASGAELGLVPRPQRSAAAAGPGARADRAGLLGRSVAERNCNSGGDPTRYGEDENTKRARPPGGRAGTGAEVTNEPDFRELVGDEGAGDERLRRVHDLLVAAGPPAEMSARVTN